MSRWWSPRHAQRASVLSTRATQHGKRWYRPRLETLEDRLAPAGLLVAGTDQGSSLVQVYDADTGSLRGSFEAFPGFTGGVEVATGDLSGDLVADIVVAAGPGGGPHVRVFDGRTLAPLTRGPLASFFALDPGFTGGVSLALADVNGDDFDDLIVGAGPGGGPHVKAYSGRDGALLTSFFAFGESFTGGVDVGAGDLTGDGAAEIIVGAGPGGGPHVRTFLGATGQQLPGPLGSFFAFDAGFPGGVRVDAGDLNGDRAADLVVSAGPGGGPHVKAYSGRDGMLLSSFFAFSSTFTGGVDLGIADLNGDGTAEILAGAGSGGGPHVRAFNGVTGQQFAGSLESFFPFAADFRGGVEVAGDQRTLLQARSGSDGEPHAGRVVTEITTSQGTIEYVQEGLASYFEGSSRNLPPTGSGAPPAGVLYNTQWTAQPNIDAANFQRRGLPAQTSDWWSPMIWRSANHPSDPNGWPGAGNNGPHMMFTNPMVLGLMADQTNNASRLQFSLGQTTTLTELVPGSHFQLGNGAPVEVGGNATDLWYNGIPPNKNNSLDVQVGIFDPSVAPPTPLAQRAVPATNLVVQDYSDWGATFGWTDPANTMGMSVTAMTGNPYTYFRKSTTGNVELYFATQLPVVTPGALGVTLTPRLVYANAAEGAIVVAVPQVDYSQQPAGFTYYGIFGPAGSVWTPTTNTVSSNGQNVTYPAKVESNLAGKTYFSIAVLPSLIVNAQGNFNERLFEIYREYAYAFPTNPPNTPTTGAIGSTQAIPDFNPETGVLTTTFQVTTQLMEPGPSNSNVNGVLFALYPHQWKNLTPASLALLHNSPSVNQFSMEGQQRLLIPDLAPLPGTNLNVSSFQTQLTYRGGILPVLPSGIQDPQARATLLRYLRQVATTHYDTFTGPNGVGNFNTGIDVYASGKEMLRVANLLPLFDQLLGGPDQAEVLQLRNTLLGQVKTFLTNWFDASDFHFFLHDTVWNTMLAYFDGGFGSATTNNDHHFHYGYFLKTAALIARYDPNFITQSQFGPILQLLARDVANWDRTDSRFPYLREFNPYNGHSWADGAAEAQDGNNQESSSEAMNFASGLILLGEALMNSDPDTGRKMRDTGIYLFTTEEETIGQSWLNVDGDNFPVDFTDSYDSTTLMASIDTQADQPPTTMISVQANGSAATTTRPDLIQLPRAAPFVIQVEHELMLVTAVAEGPVVTTSSGNRISTYNYTVVRGIEGTTVTRHWIGNNASGTVAANVGILPVMIRSPLFRRTNLATALAAGSAGQQVQLQVQSAAAFPSSGSFLISIGQEVLEVTAGAGTTTWTALRGQYGTPAPPHTTTEAVRLLSPVTRSTLGRVAGNSLYNAIFFADDRSNRFSSIYAINWLPANASTLYLGRYTHPDGSSYAASNHQRMLWDETFMFGDGSGDDVYHGDPYPVVFPDGTRKSGTPGQGGNYPGDTWAYQAFSDPQGALAALTQYVITPESQGRQPNLINTTPFAGNNGFDEGESVGMTYHFIQALLRYGEVDPDVFATAADEAPFLPTYAVFRKPREGGGFDRTYVAYNSNTSAPRTLTFRNPDSTSVSLTVPAGSYVVQSGSSAAVVTGPPTPGPTPPASPANLFFLRTTATGPVQQASAAASTYLAQQPGSFQVPVVLPVSQPGQIDFHSPMVFEIRGVSGTPLDPNPNPTQRTQFSLQVIDSLFKVPFTTNRQTGSPQTETSALVVAHVQYYRNAAIATPDRDELWLYGPQYNAANGTVGTGFLSNLYFQEYYAYRGFDNTLGPAYLRGTYPNLDEGRVVLSVWVLYPNNIPGTLNPIEYDVANTQIGLRLNATVQQMQQSLLQIPYSGVTVTPGA